MSKADARLGEEGYSVTSSNCQHFVSSIRNGISYSPEVEAVLKRYCDETSDVPIIPIDLAVAYMNNLQLEPEKMELN